MHALDMLREELARLRDSVAVDKARQSQIDAEAQEHAIAIEALTGEREAIDQRLPEQLTDIDSLERTIALLEEQVRGAEPADVGTSGDEPSDEPGSGPDVPRRTVEGRGGYSMRPGLVRTPITEDGAKGTGVREEDRELVFEIVEAYGPISQYDVRVHVEDLLGCVEGTASAITSAALLQLRVAGRVEFTGERVTCGTGTRKSAIWKATSTMGSEA